MENKIVAVLNHTVSLVPPDWISVEESKELVVRPAPMTGFCSPGRGSVSYLDETFYPVSDIIKRVKNTILGLTIWIRKYVYSNLFKHTQTVRTSVSSIIKYEINEFTLNHKLKGTRRGKSISTK